MDGGPCGAGAADATVRPVDGGAPLDHFARLGLPARFDLDPAELAASHRERMRLVHPDRFALASAEARAQALEQATALNDALRTLQDPVARAEYLLELRGAPSPAAADEAMALDPAFRMEVVELEAAFDELDAVDGREERDRIARAVAARYEAALAALGAALDADTGETWALAVEAARLRRLRALLQRRDRRTP